MFQNIHNWPLEHWHIELCSKCTLLCPRCSRQRVPEGLQNKDLSLDWFKENFTGLLYSNLKKITFCGDDGDPIYAKDLLPIIKWLRKENDQVQFVIVTNGSYKTKAWWEELGSILNEKDHIHFSLDGWDQESNNKYRVNCDWKSIIQGIECLRTSDVYKTWATIAFKFNEDKIGHIEDQAKQLGFDTFQLTLSTTFNKVYPDSYPADDPLQPSDKYISSGRFTRTHKRLTNKIWNDSVVDVFTQRYNTTKAKENSIVPLCMVGAKGLYINAQGRFFPCCWTGLRYPHNKGIFSNIETQSKNLGEVLDDPKWSYMFEDFTHGKGPIECVSKCSSKKWNLEHATSW